jgi:hypothetical protein
MSAPSESAFTTATIERVAAFKKLEGDWLRNRYGLKNEFDGMLIPYPNRERLRQWVETAHPTLWLGNGTTTAYIDDKTLANARERGDEVIVEGESDRWTLEAHGIPALGVPGASMTNCIVANDVADIERIYVIREPDDAGEKFVAGVVERLREIKFVGELFVIDLQATCGVKDPSDLHVRNPQAFDAQWHRAREKAEQVSDFWPRLTEPVIPKIAVPPMPLELLPPSLAPWIQDEAERMGIWPEMIALPALVALGSVIGCGVAIAPKRNDRRFLVIPSTWGAVVAPPGFLKTPAFHEALAPLTELCRQERERCEKDRAEKEARRKIAEIERESLAAKLTGYLRKSKPTADDAAAVESTKQRIREFDDEIAALNVTERRFLTNDCTIQKLALLCAENPNGLLMHREEIAGWLATFDNAGHGEDRKFFIEAWQGRSPYTVDRIGRGTVHVPRLSIAVVGCIQPDVMRKYVEQATGTSEFNDGMLQRFQLVAHIDELPPWVNVDREPDERARARAFAIFERLATFNAAERGARLVDGIPTLSFAPDAQELFDQYRDELERRVRTDEELQANPPLLAHISKFRSLMPAMALLYHLAEAAADSFDTFGTQVSLRAAKIGAAWTDYLEPHARKLFAGGSVPAYSPTERLTDEIEFRHSITDGTSLREIYRHHWRGLDSAERVKEALAPMIGAHWVRLERGSVKGRPSEIIRLHPDLQPEA